MKLFLGFVGVLLVLVTLLFLVVAQLDRRSHQRELELTFSAIVVAKETAERLNQIVVEDSVGPIVIERARNELYEFVETGDTIIKKEGEPTCLVQNQQLHKHHIFEVYAHH